MSAQRVRVLVAGGGVAALETVLALRELARDVVTTVLIAPDEDFVYRPLAVVEPFGAGEARRWALAALADRAGAGFIQARVAAVDPDRWAVTLDDGERIDFDALVLALGAAPADAVPGALRFAGPEDSSSLADVLDRVRTGELHHLAFAAPSGSGWLLPLYELALLTAEWLAANGVVGAAVTLVTPEDRPLASFGEEASLAIAELLGIRGVRVVPSAVPVAFEEGRLRLAGGPGSIAADAVVSLPRLRGRELPGIPADGSGFVPVDEFGRVLGLDRVYAAGDLTQLELKQGGLATQQADSVASAIAADAGLPVTPEPFRPILRGLLLTGLTPRFMRAEPGSRTSEIDTEPLWWPPGKIVGRHLAPFLAEHAAV